MERLLNLDCNIREYSPTTLAFIGDSVFEILVRERLVCKGNRPVADLNKEKVKLVCCASQAEMIKKIEPLLTNDELKIYKSGRNSHVKAPRNASSSDYHNATGLEALFGYLYLSNNIQRIRELYFYTQQNSDGDINEEK
ncbi:MAG: ribonuclease III [Clostridiales bacterium]|nr:ribonuclease III [Clostridiales bacterium]